MTAVRIHRSMATLQMATRFTALMKARVSLQLAAGKPEIMVRQLARVGAAPQVNAAVY